MRSWSSAVHLKSAGTHGRVSDKEKGGTLPGLSLPHKLQPNMRIVHLATETSEAFERGTGYFVNGRGLWTLLTCKLYAGGTASHNSEVKQFTTVLFGCIAKLEMSFWTKLESVVKFPLTDGRT